LLGGQLSQQVIDRNTWSYLLVSAEGRSMAVAVDDLEDESEVLLKPLGYPLTGISGFVGATIRTDGAVQLVLDLTSHSFPKGSATHARPTAKRQAAGRILVVDDSPTTRAVLRNVFTAAGYIVSTASDGVDALERLAMQTVDIVISDVEMPRLNGFDLARRIKAKFGLPIILVTGREKESHRREGLAAGADAYVVKSTFEDKSLLDLVEQFV
jgi:two-component system chemotaxis sensor kinase CheA